MSVTIRDAMTDPALFGGVFGGDSFAAWRALLAGFHGLPLRARLMSFGWSWAGAVARPTLAPC